LNGSGSKDRIARREAAGSTDRAEGAVAFFAWLPVGLFLIAVAVLFVLDLDTIRESPLLLATLNTLFCAAAGLMIAYLAAQTYRMTDSRAVLSLGVGALAFGLASVLAGLLIGRQNAAITVHNAGVLFAGACFVVSALWALAATSTPTAMRPVKGALVFSYVGMVALVVLLTSAAVLGLTPEFYVPGLGPTAVRQVVLGLAVVGFLAASTLFGALYRGSRSRFLLFCCAGLAMIGVGLGTVMMGGAPGSPLNWLGRVGQYLGSVYLVLAVVSVERGHGPWLLPLERALRESEDRYQSLVDLSPEAILVHADGTFVFANPAAVTLFGAASAEEIVGKDSLELVHPDYHQTVMRRVDAALAEEPLPPGQIMGRRLDGLPVDIEVSSRRVMFDGRTAVQVIAHDVSERMRAEEERLELERQLQQSQRLESLGVLAGGIAHDFNNILMAVLGNAELALSELPPSAPARGNLLEITRASRRATELCRQMLAYSGRGRFVIEPIDLRLLIEDMLNLLKSTISKKALLNLRLENDLPPLLGDASQISQVIMNLVINASEAIGERSGVITISTGAMECPREYLRDTYLDQSLPTGLYLTLEVSDTGVGMDKETQLRLFEPFFTTKFTGRGLGLSAVLGIVRGHKGALKLYSEPGKGTSFKLLFPVADVQGTQARAIDGDADAWQGEGTVLLVDDEHSIRALGKQMLERLGFQVLCASDGREALTVYAEHRNDISLVLLDLTMPHMDGEEALRGLRRLDPGVRVVMTSGYTEQDIVARFAGKALAGFVPKPYTMAVLRERLRAALEG
jgi:PAS domain S-box-containing protein